MKRKRTISSKIIKTNETVMEEFELPVMSPEIQKEILKLSKIYTPERLKKVVYMVYKLARLAYELSQKK